MVKKFSASDITFKEMSEKKAVNTFQDDGYFDYQKRNMRYGKYLPRDSIWANAPARMFVAFSDETPVAVIGFSRYKGFLLDAGVHVREEYRNKGLGSILLDKVISEKGNKTLLVNVANSAITGAFRRKGYTNMIIDEIPQELQEELKGVKYPDQVQKWMMYVSPEWQKVLKQR